jgi:hypothetical protein
MSIGRRQVPVFRALAVNVYILWNIEIVEVFLYGHSE